MIFNEGDIVIVKSILTIHGQDGDRIYTGMAEEDRTKGQINKTSALENCETSSIGRALAAAGLGGEEYASANEVENAIHQQKQPATTSGVLDKLAEARPNGPGSAAKRLIGRIRDAEQYLAEMKNRNKHEARNSREKHLKTKVLEEASVADLSAFFEHLKKKATEEHAPNNGKSVLDLDIVTAVS